MKVLDVDLFQEGLHRNITMLTRLSTEIEAIHRAVEGLVQMEDQLKGEGGNAIHSFYEECHVPFLQFFQLFSEHYQEVLRQMEAALYSLEPDPSGYILETFLEGELEQGLTEIGLLTANLTDEANSIMDQVSDIVGLPHLDDSGVQEGVISSKRKRDDTISQLYEFDATQTNALQTIEQDMQTMENWLSDLEGMFESGLTDIHFQTENWGVLTSKNNLKTELAYRTSPIAGLSNLSNRENQLTTMLQAFIAGTGPIRFGYGGLISIHHPFVGTDMIALSCPRPEVNGTEQEDINQNPFVKSFHSFKGINEDFWNGVGLRRDKALDSPYDFVNYWTFGVSDGILSGANERSAKMFDSKLDFLDYATFGFSGMVKEAVSPEESFSKEHWLNSFGLAGSIFGVGKLVTSPVKKSGNVAVNGNAINEVKATSKTESNIETVKTSESIQTVLKKNDYTIDEFLKLLHPDRLLIEEELRKVNIIRDQIGIPPKGTMMAKVIPQRDLYNYLYNKDYSGVRGFTAMKEHSAKLENLEMNFEGARLDYNNTTFKITNGVDGISQSVGGPDRFYGTIEYNLWDSNQLSIPRWEPNSDSYPYTGRGFTGSKEIVLPEYYQEARKFVEGDMMQIRDSKTGKPLFEFIYDGDLESWVEIN